MQKRSGSHVVSLVQRKLYWDALTEVSASHQLKFCNLYLYICVCLLGHFDIVFCMCVIQYFCLCICPTGIMYYMRTSIQILKSQLCTNWNFWHSMASGEGWFWDHNLKCWSICIFFLDFNYIQIQIAYRYTMKKKLSRKAN